MNVIPVLVLDTNAVLDWLLFRNPAGDAMHQAIARGAVRWQATAAMRMELSHLLTRADFSAWDAGPPAIWQAWDRHCTVLDDAAPTLHRPALRCTDPDDQKFIDFAVAANARWLVSRDRAVLKLGRRLREHGVIVTTPAGWSMGQWGQGVDGQMGSTDGTSSLGPQAPE